uniref:Uncharacterized protein n=1 Tax=Anguilla anguilla TaxID=7936 RepID=A0A0E9SDV0_ANGAN
MHVVQYSQYWEENKFRFISSSGS